MKLLSRIGYHEFDFILGIHIPKDTSLPFRGMIIHNKKQNLEIIETKTFEETGNLVSWGQQWPGVPIILHSELEQVEKSVPTSETELISNVLGVQMNHSDEFAWQRLRGKNGKDLVSLIRKDSLQQVSRNLGSLNQRLIYHNFSPAVLTYLIPFYQSYTPRKSYRIQENTGWKKGFWVGQEEEFENIELADLESSLETPPEFIPLLGAMIHFQYSQGMDLENLSGISDKRKALKKSLRFIKWTVNAGILLVSVLLFGIIISSTLDDFNQNLSKKISVNDALFEQITQNNQHIEQDQSFLENANQLGIKASRLPFYLDAVGTRCPEGITLDQILFQPDSDFLKKQLHRYSDEAVSFFIEGKARYPKDITAFITKLEEIESLGKTEIISSSYDFRNKEHDFRLIIFSRHDL